jgi:DNA-binding transcriptional ArsR family regulator
MTDQYEPPERTLEMTAEQAAAFADPTRNQIVGLITERPASISQLAAVLDKPKGTVGHHVKVLEELGLIAVVRTRQVRALTEKYYGRTARTFMFPHMEGPEDGVARTFFHEALAEMRDAGEHEAHLVTIRHARIPDERAFEWEERLLELAEEFASERGGATSYGLLIGLYPTDRPGLPADDEADDEEERT